MLKAKRLKSMFVLYSACAVMATGFTSQAASEQPEVTTITETKGENTNTHTAVQAISQNIVASAQEMTDASQQVIADNIAKKEEEERLAREKAEQEVKEKAEREKFLVSMGMDRKERKKMNKREWYIYWIVPTIILIISTILFMRDTMTARMYPDDIRKICELQEAVVIAVWIVINGIYFWIMNRKARRG